MSGVGAILLAAGGSCRMGQSKQLLPLGGRTLLRIAADAAMGAGCHPVVVVLGPQPERMRELLSDLPLDLAVNAEWEAGIGTSIRCGTRRLLENTPHVGAAVILLCDQPMVTADTIERIMRGYEQSQKLVCAASYAGTIGPPVCVGRSLFSELLALPDDRGAKALWTARPQDVCTVPCAEAALDIDTPEDYERSRDLL